MTRPYSPYSRSRSDHVGRHAAAPTDDLRRGHHEDYDEYPYDTDAYADFDGYDFADEAIDRRWIWVAGVAGAVLLVAVICTVVILGGGDSGSVSATIAPPTTSQPARTAPPSHDSSPAPTPTTSLAPETMTTVTPSPSASATPTESAPPTAAPAPPPAAAAPAPNPRAVTYTVTGNRQLIDLVTVIYTDQQGALQTDVNVALPWTKTVVLNPGVELSSVTATSVAGQLNCSITDAAGATIAAQNSNTIITTCTK
jgi:Mycobacterium membrane protein